MGTIARLNKSVNNTTSLKRAALNPEAAPRLAGKSDRILALLAAAGDAGCLNSELWKIAYELPQRINDLRKRGYTIIAKPEGKNGLWRYRLISDESQKATAPAETNKPPSFEDRRRSEEAERFPLFAAVAP